MKTTRKLIAYTATFSEGKAIGRIRALNSNDAEALLRKRYADRKIISIEIRGTK